MRRYVQLIFGTPLLLASIQLSAGDIPNSTLTPGMTNPDVSQANIDSTICNPGYTQTIRPPAYYTTTLKKQQIKKWHYLDTDASHYEEDHLISLEIGGHPRDPANLWPQPYQGKWNARVKDELENKLHKMVCAHQLTLRDAQTAISENWVSAYQQYVGAGP